MALHGEVKINGTEILRWQAVRQIDRHSDRDPKPDDVLRYKCEVRWTDGGIGKFEVFHQYGDGAAALAASVLG